MTASNVRAAIQTSPHPAVRRPLSAQAARAAALRQLQVDGDAALDQLKRALRIAASASANGFDMAPSTRSDQLRDLTDHPERRSHSYRLSPTVAVEATLLSERTPTAKPVAERPGDGSCSPINLNAVCSAEVHYSGRRSLPSPATRRLVTAPTGSSRVRPSSAYARAGAAVAAALRDRNPTSSSATGHPGGLWVRGLTPRVHRPATPTPAVTEMAAAATRTPAKNDMIDSPFHYPLAMSPIGSRPISASHSDNAKQNGHQQAASASNRLQSAFGDATAPANPDHGGRANPGSLVYEKVPGHAALLLRVAGSSIVGAAAIQTSASLMQAACRSPVAEAARHDTQSQGERQAKQTDDGPTGHDTHRRQVPPRPASAGTFRPARGASPAPNEPGGHIYELQRRRPQSASLHRGFTSSPHASGPPPPRGTELPVQRGPSGALPPPPPFLCGQRVERERAQALEGQRQARAALVVPRGLRRLEEYFTARVFEEAEAARVAYERSVTHRITPDSMQPATKAVEVVDAASGMQGVDPDHAAAASATADSGPTIGGVPTQGRDDVALQQSPRRVGQPWAPTADPTPADPGVRGRLAAVQQLRRIRQMRIARM